MKLFLKLTTFLALVLIAFIAIGQSSAVEAAGGGNGGDPLSFARLARMEEGRKMLNAPYRVRRSPQFPSPPSPGDLPQMPSPPGM